MVTLFKKSFPILMAFAAVFVALKNLGRPLRGGFKFIGSLTALLIAIRQVRSAVKGLREVNAGEQSNS